MNWLRRVFCRHMFRGYEMGRRDESGKLDWACQKCGKVYRFDYGLQANDAGTITGPWGGPTQEADK